MAFRMNSKEIILFVFLIFLIALAFFGFKDNKINSGGWKTYSNKEVNLTFKYPENWEIKQDYFYTTAAGIRAERPTIVLQKIDTNDSNNWIWINPRQFQCEFGTCINSINSRYDDIATYSKNQEILEVLTFIASELKSEKVK